MTTFVVFFYTNCTLCALCSVSLDAIHPYRDFSLPLLTIRALTKQLFVVITKVTDARVIGFLLVH
jgi:hypothetical protein